jgi:hypothetical protein
MRYILILSLVFSILSCDDGDFDKLSFELETTVNTCGKYVLFRTNIDKTEALIVVLKDTDIVSEEGSKTISITPENIKYRVFDDSIDNDYFCADIPPLKPSVLKEWNAISGESNQILISTTSIIDETLGIIIGYKHQIDFQNLVIENQDQQEVFESYNFGSFNTSTITLKKQ